MNKIIDDLIENLINNNLHIMPGNNGPYNCNDTSFRNISHWIGILKYKYFNTKNKEYKFAISKLADILCENICDNGTIKCFYDNSFSETNGVIGQAWVIEGLINAYNVCKDDKYYDAALRIFLSQKYDYNFHLWKIVNCSNEILGFDYVFNHQLWFAASGYMINYAKENKIIYTKLEDFTKNIEKLYTCYNDGLLSHIAIVGNNFISVLKRIIKSTIKNIKYIGNKKKKLEIEKGYHLFDLYGFALLYKYSCGKLNINTKKFQKVLKYGLDIKNNDYELRNYFDVGTANKYGYAYNSPAFEFPYIDFIFNDENMKKYYKEMYKYQIDNLYDYKKKKFSNNTSDPNTLTSRIYELCRYFEESEKNERK